jgi:hypothetical protein
MMTFLTNSNEEDFLIHKYPTSHWKQRVGMK